MAECMELSGQMIMPEPFDLDCGLPKQVKEETFTENGSYEIMPDEGFQLEKAKVNVEVFIPEKQAKVLEVQKNGSYEVLPDESKVLSKVSVNVNTPEQKKETTFGIGYDKNGKYLIRPQEGYVFSEGMVDVNVLSQIDLTQIGFTEVQNQQYNEPFLNGIDYAKAIQKDWGTDVQPQNFTNDERLVYFPFVDMSKITDLSSYFEGCKNFELIADNLDFSSCQSMVYIFRYCKNLKSINITTTTNVINFANAFYRCSSLKSVVLNTDSCNNIGQMFYACEEIEKIELTSIENVTKWTAGDAFVNCKNLIYVKLPKWKLPNINLSQSSRLSIESVKGIIDDAITAPKNTRILTLYSQILQDFSNAYPEYVAEGGIASQKGISLGA